MAVDLAANTLAAFERGQDHPAHALRAAGDEEQDLGFGRDRRAEWRCMDALGVPPAP